ITLDDTERSLDADILVIADSRKSIGLAGVMGGANSEVTEDTETIFLESAYFNPVNIRKTARKLGLPSEASHRFERGVDIESVVEAGNRAAYLMQEYAGGEVVGGVIDVYPEPYQPLEIELSIDMVNRVLGLELNIEMIERMLTKLKFNITNKEDGILTVAVPAFRGDVEREADLIEEVARMYGYNNIPVTQPESKQQGAKTNRQEFEDITRDLMLASGLDEVVNFSLTGEDKYTIFNLSENSRLKRWVHIKNPLNEAYAVMRTSLIPGLMEVLANNAKRQLDKMFVFEIGNVYFKENGKKPYNQTLKLAGGSMGYEEDSWDGSAADFFYLKGVLETYFDRVGIEDYEFEATELSYLHPGRTAKITADDVVLGTIGEISPDIIEELNLKERTTVFQLDMEALLKKANLVQIYKELPRFPAVERDLAVLVDKDITSGDILKVIVKRSGKLLKDVDIFDLYQGDQIPENKKSIAFKLLFQADDRTLRDEEVNDIFTKLVKKIDEQFSAQIRGI
ncbi:MAG: phenylalanine--tRNA ligase subunit beta, partial [bacterium]